MNPKTRNRIVGGIAVVVVLIWQVWLGIEVITPEDIPLPDPQTLTLDPSLSFSPDSPYATTEPITITGILTNVRLIYYQVP